jgi:surface antigen Omp85-like protein/WD40 repeat protein
VTPSWLSATTVMFASDRGGRPFGIYAVDIASGAVRRLNGTGRSAQFPTLSPDGKTIVFVGYTTDGYDLFSVAAGPASWSTVDSTPIPADSSPFVSSPAIEVNAPEGSVYRPWRTLLPQFWMPTVESDAGEVKAGAETFASDALGRHAYAANVAWAASRARPDWSVAYAYDRWWPTFFASISDDTDPWRGGDIQTREVNAGAIFNVARVRWSQSVLAAVNASEDIFSCASCPDPLPQDVRRGAIRTGWALVNAKNYGYSISRESGTTLRLTWEEAPEALGSDAASRAMTIDARGYVHLGPRHAAAAFRAAAASAWGDENARRLFSAAGSDAASASFDFGRSAVGLLRGFESDSVAGSRVAVANVDYRFPLRYIERGSGTVPLFLRTMHGAVFVDAANAWDRGFSWNDVRVSTGAELSLDTVVGFGLPLSFTAGLAWRHDPVGRQDGVAVFGRIGRAF